MIYIISSMCLRAQVRLMRIYSVAVCVSVLSHGSFAGPSSAPHVSYGAAISLMEKLLVFFLTWVHLQLVLPGILIGLKAFH